jgi:succinyl-CoA synthetase beta subunit
MNLHEYQAKELLRNAGIPVANGVLLYDAIGVHEEILEVLGNAPWVVKAQVHSGARGKAGGVKLVHTVDEARSETERLLGSQLVTIQTGSAGLPVTSVLIESGCAIAQEFYLSLTLDRARKGFAFVGSADGGMDIEEVAEHHPERVISVFVPFGAGLQPFVARTLAFGMKLTPEQMKGFAELVKRLYDMAHSSDALMLEINPLVWTKDGQWLALDCKIQIDDNALYRQKALADERDWAQEDAREVEAAQWALNYIALDGDIGCMVNGAGLAMATMDLIQLHGGKPANFLDVGGGTTPERVAAAFKLILSSSDVKAILVNIFGGIVRCDLIADGILQAVKEVGLTLPVVVRLEGTNADKGREMLAASGLNIVAENDLETATKTAVRLAGEKQ